MGRPVGSTKPKIMSEAIILALNREADEGEGKRVNALAEKLVKLALAGDMAAIKEVNDRVDGKPPQAHIGGDEDDPPIKITRVEIVAASGDGKN